jgi:hypothetical protein
MGENNKEVFDAYIKALEGCKTDNKPENIEALKTAAKKLSDILVQNEEDNKDIKDDIKTIESIDINNIDKTVIDNLKIINYIGLKFNTDAAAAAESTGITVKKLDKTQITDLKLFEKTTAYKATAPTGNYIVFKATADEFSTLTGGKKSRKSKTHRQKKVHRSTQKRNGRKKTSNRRK